MKAIVCEMCGSNDVVKLGDYYVCQSCGTKYEPEAAKKLLVEVDDTVKLGNLYDLARKARREGNVKNAENYYGQILSMNPNDWEAYFYRGYFQAMGTVVARLATAALDFDGTLATTIEMLDSSSISEADLLHIAIEMNDSIDSFFRTFALNADNSWDGYNNISMEVAQEHEAEHRANIKAIARPCLRAIDWYEKRFVLDAEQCKPLLDYSIRVWYWVLNKSFFLQLDPSDMLPYFKKLSKYSPDLVIQLEGVYFTKESYDSIVEILKGKGSAFGVPLIATYGRCDKETAKLIQKRIMDREGIYKQGCYIATCVYGTYDCPQVWTLRRFRDYRLANSHLGRSFIKFYYAVSPAIVKLFGTKAWFHRVWYARLNKIVQELNARGYADTPYSDRVW